MKKGLIKILTLVLSTWTLVFSSCAKNDEILYNGSVVEWDGATYNARSSGKEYTLFTRVPLYGGAVNNNQPLVTRKSGTVKLRVNLVGAHRGSATEIGYRVVDTETTAVAGTHYTTDNKVVIPANSSFAEVEVKILDAGAPAGVKTLVLELTGNTEILPSNRHKQIGLSINQQ